MTNYQIRESSDYYHGLRLERKEAQIQRALRSLLEERSLLEDNQLSFLFNQKPEQNISINTVLDSILTNEIVKISEIQNINFTLYDIDGSLIGSTVSDEETESLSNQVLTDLEKSEDSKIVITKSDDETLLRSSFSYIFNINEKKLISLCAAVECIHSYSLIHDDLPAMDDDELRRGNPTTHKKFDEATAILAGDALQPFAFELISTIKTTDRNIVQMISSLSEACGYLGMVGGQIKDINSNQIKDVESLDSMHSEKTGRLIQASIETAGILSGLSASDIESLKEYGGKIGLAFQIQDDIIDIESPASVSGKDQGSDIGKDKTTYPSLVGLEASKVRAQELSNDAKKILQPINKNTDNLDKLADYIVSRKA